MLRFSLKIGRMVFIGKNRVGRKEFQKFAVLEEEEEESLFCMVCETQ